MRNRRIRATHTSVADFKPKCHCGSVATMYLEIHTLGGCDREPTTSQLFCDACFKTNMSRAQEAVDAGSEECESCGLAFVTLSDIIVRMCPLEAKGERSR